MVPEVLVELVESLKEKYPVKLICKCIGVPRSTYYRWKKCPKREATSLEILIKEICELNKFRYGHRKVTSILKRKHGIYVNRKTTQRIMQKDNLQCRVKMKRKNWINGESKIIVENLLERNFKADNPDEKWVTDITYLPYGSSMLYLCTIMDLYNNEVVAYRIQSHQDVSLVLDTLNAAVMSRNPKNVILHSDQGSVYTSYAFQGLAKEKSITTSMSRRGNCLDNAVIESFHSSLKSEEFNSLERESITNSIVIQKVHEYMYYYNQERIQEKLNYLSPIDFRKQVA